MRKIRNLKDGDEIVIQKIYQMAFSGFPWHEDLSSEEVERRWNIQKRKRGFGGLVAEENGEVVGAIWWDLPSLEELRAERGDALAEFTVKIQRGKLLIWEREVIVSPQYQGKKIGFQLRVAFIEKISQTTKKALILTRMRDDNIPIIGIAEKLGFLRTGIKVSSSQKSNTFHEYWYLEIRKEEQK